MYLKSPQKGCANQRFPRNTKVCAEDCSFDYSIDIQITEKCCRAPLSALFSPRPGTFLSADRHKTRYLNM